MIDYARYFRLSFWLWFYKIKVGLQAMFRKKVVLVCGDPNNGKLATIGDKQQKEMNPYPFLFDMILPSASYVDYATKYVPCSPNRKGLQQRKKKNQQAALPKESKATV
jgi:hypothetical protein